MIVFHPLIYVKKYLKSYNVAVHFFTFIIAAVEPRLMT